MLSEQQVKDIIARLREEGYEVGIRDIAYAVLAGIYGPDRHLGYKAIFGVSPDIPFEQYDHLERVNKCEIEVSKALYGQESRPDDISFDELKQGLIADMRALEELRDSRDGDNNPVLDAKEMAQVVARIADIRVKLTEKFGTTERVIEQRVVVSQKYDAICPYCNHEIAIGNTEQHESYAPAQKSE